MWQDYRESKTESLRNNVELATTGSNVEVRTEGKKPRFITPFNSKVSRNNHRTTSGEVLGGGIMIRVEVETDRDNDLDRLRDYLVGL